MSSVPERSDIDAEYKWELESLYADDDEWEAAFESAQERLDELHHHTPAAAVASFTPVPGDGPKSIFAGRERGVCSEATSENTVTTNSVKAPGRSGRGAARDRRSLGQSGARRPMTSLCSSSLVPLPPAVLTSSAFPGRPAPFIPTHVGWFDSLCGWE